MSDTLHTHPLAAYCTGLIDTANMNHITPAIKSVLTDCSEVIAALDKKINLQYQPINTAPKEGFFYVAGWVGDPIFSDKMPYDQIGWKSEPEWIEVKTVDESWARSHNLHRRGWNHRNGPFPIGSAPTHWRPYTTPDPIPHNLPILL